MKFLGLLTLFIGYALAQAEAPVEKTLHRALSNEVPKGLVASDWQAIRTAYEAGRHAFAQVEGQLGVWQSWNPGQQWVTKFDERGFIARPKNGTWSWGLELKSYGFGEDQHAIASKPVVRAEGQRLTYVWDATVQEWFVNDKRGLEHGFTVLQKPGWGCRTEQVERPDLNVYLAARGTLRPAITTDAQAVEFRDTAGATVLTYAGLKVWDADGKTLPSHFAAAEKNGVRITVDERGARYPLTIDPLAQQAYLKASNTGTGDRFSWSVDVSGDTVVVSSPFEDSSSTGVNGPSDDNEGTTFNAGAVYVFVRSGTTWTQQAFLKASNTGAGDTFGSSVSISGDTVVVGAGGEDSSTAGLDEGILDSGAVYVFVRSGTTWTQEALLKASNPGINDGFGGSVSISGDTVVVGAAGEDSSTTGVDSTPNENAAASGAAYVFVRNGTTWSQQAYLKASNTGADDSFALQVAVSGDNVIVGAPGEDSSTTGVNSTPNEGANSAGAAYLFSRSGTTWTQQAYLKASNTGPIDSFGGSVSISGDTAVVGSANEDSSTTGVNSTPNQNATSAGAAYVFVRSGVSWVQQAYIKASNTEDGDRFGNTVAVEGNTLVVGANNEGSGTTGVDSIPNEGAGVSGAAYVFARNGTTWAQQSYLKASNTDGEDEFGFSVAVSGGTVIVGAPFEDSISTGVNSTSNEGGINTGAAYVFNTYVNTPPTISDIADRAINEDTGTGAIAVTIGDAESPVGTLTLTRTSSNTALVPNGNAVLGGSGANRTITVTPAANQVGTTTITLTVSDIYSTAVDSFVLTVSNVNDVPTVANVIPDQGAVEDVPFSFAFAANTFADIDPGNVFSYSAIGVPAWLTFTPATRTFSGTPANANVGFVDITVTATDNGTPAASSVSDTFRITVANVNDAPTVANAIPDQSATEDAAFSFAFASNIYSDVDPGASLTYSASGLPAWLTFNPATRTFSGTPGNANVGFVDIAVTATDNGTPSTASVSDTFRITVLNVNDAPTLANAIPDQNATEETDFSFTFAANTFADVDPGNVFTYSATGLPAWLTFDPATRKFSGTPSDANVGFVNITVTATDNGVPASASIGDTFRMTVANTNDVPRFTKGPDKLHPPFSNGLKSFPGWATGIDDGDAGVTQPISFNVTNDNHAIFSVQPDIAGDGTLIYTLTGTEGSATVTVTITDDASAGGPALTSAPQTFIISVAPAPEIAVERASLSGIADGGSTDFGSVLVGTRGTPVTFTIRNSGNGALEGLAITSDGAMPGDFAISAISSTTVPSGGSATFSVTFSPSGPDFRTCMLHLASNEDDENPYDIRLTGIGNTGVPLSLVQEAYAKPAAVGVTQAGDGFGWAVASSGNTVMIGAPFEGSNAAGTPNEGAVASGAAYVFVRNGHTWTQQAYLKAGNIGAGDNFGNSVAISGDSIVIGAWFEDSATTGVNSTPNEGGSASGAAYVFVRNGTTWTQQAYLKAGNTGTGDKFGASVCISGDTVVVGAPEEDSSTTGVNSSPDEGGANAGAAYVFTRTGTTWAQQAYLKPGNTGTRDRFGESVAISSDRIVVGAPGEDSSTNTADSTPNENAIDAGAAYIFERSGSAWSQKSYLKANRSGPDDLFGTAVSVSGDWVLVGAPREDSLASDVNGVPDEAALDAGAAYAFRPFNTGTQISWAAQRLKAGNVGPGDLFGSSVSVSGDFMVIGAPGEDGSTSGMNGASDENAFGSGAAYAFVYKVTGTGWTQHAYVKPGNTGASDAFGQAVAVSGDAVVTGSVAEDSANTGVNGSLNENATDSGAVYTFGLAAPEIEVESPPGDPMLTGTFAWQGSNENGESTPPVGLTDIKAIAAGPWHTLALRKDGTVVAWGETFSGVIDVPTGLTDVKAIAGGQNLSLALKNDGTVVGWGWAPVVDQLPTGLTGIIAIATGEHHSAVVKSDGTVVAWGDNSIGQTDVPPGLTDVRTVAVGDWFTVALKNDGTVVTWPSVGRIKVPEGLTDVKAISAGSTHVLALKNDGTVVGWGGEGPNSEYAIVPPGLSGIIGVAAGTEYSVALKQDGSIVKWGRDLSAFGLAPPITAGVAIAAGKFHIAAIERAVDFGFQNTGTTSASKTFKIKNTGRDPLIISSVAKTQPVDAFTVNTAGVLTTLPAFTGETTFTVTFNPQYAGFQYTKVRVQTNDSDESAYEIVLAGTGNAIPVAPDVNASATTGDQKVVIVPATDPTGDTLSIVSTTPDAHITVNGTGGLNVTFTPAANYAGPATIGYTVSDGKGGTASGTIFVTITDNDAPTISGSFSPLVIYAGTLPDFRSQAVVSDNVGTPTITQSPLQGSATVAGHVAVSLTAHDTAGNTAEVTFDVVVRPAGALSEVRFAPGTPAPGAGSQGGPPADALLAKFGIPAIDDAGNVAFVGHWTGLASGKGSGLFTDRFLAKIGGEVSGIAGAKFKTFSDPVVDEGRVASLATFSGVPAAGAAGVMSFAPDGTPTVAARTGEIATETSSKFKAFKAVEVSGNSIAVFAQLAAGTGTPKTTAASDLGVWVKDGTGPLTLALREGQALGGSTIKTLVAFLPGNGSAGHGRGWLRSTAGGWQVLALVTLANNSRGVVLVDSSDIANPRVLSLSGVTIDGGPDIANASFASYGVPTLAGSDANGFIASLNLAPGIATRADSRGIFVRPGLTGSYTTLARVGKPMGIGGVNFGLLKDPVLGADGGIAFPATIKGTGVKGLAANTLWWRPPGGALALLAQGGASTIAVGDLPGAQWKTFPSLAIAAGGRGPIFTATLVPGKGGVTTTTATGAWACDFTGAPRLLFRTGDMIGGKKLASFGLLKATVGNLGVTRSFNDVAEVVWLATFSDKSQAIVRTEVP